MIRPVTRGKHTRMWIAVIAVLVVATSAGTAAATLDLSGATPDRPARSAAAAQSKSPKPDHTKSPKPGPKPSPTPTATASPTASPTTSPTPSPTTTTPAPSTGSDVKIPLPGFEPHFGSGDILVDEARDLIYITGGKGTRDLVVTDLDGSIVRTVTDIPGAAGMTLSPDGSKLYVTASDRDWITVVDTTTYETSGHFAGTTDGTMTCPRDVAFAAGQLWFSWGCDNAPAGIGRIDPQTGAHELNAIESTDSRIISPPLLATVPSQPDMLIAGETGTNPALVFRFDATPTRLYQRAMRWTDGGSVRQLAITPDGSQVIVPSGAPYYHPAFRTADLVEVHQYPTAPYPNAVAVRPDGLVVAGISGAYEEDVYVFEPGGSAPIATYEFGHLPDQETWAHTLVDGGLAAHGNRIYAITEQLSEPDMVTLRIRLLE